MTDLKKRKIPIEAVYYGAPKVTFKKYQYLLLQDNNYNFDIIIGNFEKTF